MSNSSGSDGYVVVKDFKQWKIRTKELYPGLQDADFVRSLSTNSIQVIVEGDDDPIAFWIPEAEYGLINLP